MTARERLLSFSLRRHGIPAVLVLALFVLAYDDGAFALRTQATTAIVVWWAVLMAVVVGAARLERLTLAGRWVALALTAFTAWTLLSASWSGDVEASLVDFDLVLLYLGIFLLVGLLAGRGSGGSWADGLAVGISAIACVALASRLFPTLWSRRDLATLPSASARLSFPLGYWNGLGIFCALAVPLLFRSALVARSSVVRGLALAPLPVIVADIYLASSRGAAATLLVATVVLLVVSSRRVALVAAIAVAAAGSAVTLLVLGARHALVNGPVTGAAARSEGKTAAVLIVLACVATAGIYAAGCRLWPRRLVPSARVGRLAAIGAVALLVALAVAAHPVRRVEAFKQPPQQYSPSSPGGFAQEHLLSGNGSGRWQFWTAAVDEWHTRPWIGRGAGSFAAWWLAHSPIDYFVVDAHSLYLQTLAELGVVGLLLLLVGLLGGAAAGAARLRHLEGESRITVAALLAVVAAYLVATGIDWMWQLPVVSIVPFVCLALLVGAATLPALSDGGGESRPRSRGRLAVPALIVLAAVFALALEADQLLGQTRIDASQSAAARRQLPTAFTDAVDARDIEPWASTPYLQIALVAEQQGALVTASQAISEAIERAPDDWQLWFVRARLDTKRGLVEEGVRALRRAKSLNPMSPLFVAGS